MIYRYTYLLRMTVTEKIKMKRLTLSSRQQQQPLPAHDYTLTQYKDKLQNEWIWISDETMCIRRKSRFMCVLCTNSKQQQQKKKKTWRTLFYFFAFICCVHICVLHEKIIYSMSLIVIRMRERRVGRSFWFTFVTVWEWNIIIGQSKKYKGDDTKHTTQRHTHTQLIFLHFLFVFNMLDTHTRPDIYPRIIIMYQENVRTWSSGWYTMHDFFSWGHQQQRGNLSCFFRASQYHV